jgi:NAD(P)-dependent dehydrogenase (short-subunit alcohol dehydrogenase family)
MKVIESRTVVITGASSGIGRASAVRLARSGFRVYAGIRAAADAAALRAEHPAIEPIAIDVTDAAAIAAARQRLERELDGLGGLVNNAGVGLVAPMEHVPLGEVRRQFEVDVFGQIAVTQALLPLIRRARGRIVNMGSVGSHIAMPFGGVLCGCKSALHAINDALRLELRPSGIHVCLIEPGSIRTSAVDKTLGDVERAIQVLPPDGREHYAGMLRAFQRRAYQRERGGSPPEVVARAVHHALTAVRPRVRYPVGRDARLLVTLPRVLPDRWLDAIRIRLFGLPRGSPWTTG